MTDLPIPPYCTISGSEIILQVSTSSGPGGQHVNKTSTKVTLRWNIEQSTSISDEQRIVLQNKLVNKINKNNEIVIHCEASRSQHTNHLTAREKLCALLQNAFHVPKKRKKTKPSKGAIEKRLKQKKQRAELKKNRSSYD